MNNYIYILSIVDLYRLLPEASDFSYLQHRWRTSRAPRAPFLGHRDGTQPICGMIHPLVMSTVCELERFTHIEIVDFPMKNGGSFHSLLYVYQRVITRNHPKTRKIRAENYPKKLPPKHESSRSLRRFRSKYLGKQRAAFLPRRNFWGFPPVKRGTWESSKNQGFTLW